ncbi:DNA-binding protein [Pseudomonas aeruginosa]|nr:DNA-binding protein [Pseudomonas aeruginosa]
MAPRIEIKPSQVTFDTRTGTSSKGNPYTIREQFAYAWLVGEYPELIKMNLEDGQPPYPAGYYSIDPKSFGVGDFKRLMIFRLSLIPEAKS